jgi:hypothetical protein
MKKTTKYQNINEIPDKYRDALNNLRTSAQDNRMPYKEGEFYPMQEFINYMENSTKNAKLCRLRKDKILHEISSAYSIINRNLISEIIPFLRDEDGVKLVEFADGTAIIFPRDNGSQRL